MRDCVRGMMVPENWAAGGRILAQPLVLDLGLAKTEKHASRDSGDTWRWDNEGLHAHYCRAVAVAGDTVILSASSGHHGRRAALYRRPLDGAGAFERCADGLPAWFPDNVDTGCVATDGRTVAIGTEDGCVFLSSDAGRRWESVAKGLAPVRGVVLS